MGGTPAMLLLWASYKSTTRALQHSRNIAEEAACIDAYLQVIRPRGRIPSSYLAKGPNNLDGRSHHSSYSLLNAYRPSASEGISLLGNVPGFGPMRKDLGPRAVSWRVPRETCPRACPGTGT